MGKRVKLVVLAFSFVFLASCGQMSSSGVFKNAKIDVDPIEGDIQLSVQMSDHFSFPVGLEVPIKEYGTLAIIPGRPAQVILSAHIDIFGAYGHNINVTSVLPNGSPLPLFVNGSLLEIKLGDKYYAYASPDKIEYLGFAIEIPQLTKTLPAGFSMITDFKNQAGETLGLGVLYGPSLSGGDAGIFMLADVQGVVNKITNRSSYQTQEIQTLELQGEENDNSDSLNLRRRDLYKLRRKGLIY